MRPPSESTQRHSATQRPEQRRFERVGRAKAADPRQKKRPMKRALVTGPISLTVIDSSACTMRALNIRRLSEPSPRRRGSP